MSVWSVLASRLAAYADGARFKWLGALLPLGFGFVVFPYAGHDDKYITFWEAHALATRGAFVNYNGERLEQSSSLLFAVLLATLHALTHVALSVLATLLSASGAVLLIWATGRLAARVDSRIENPARLLTAACTPVMYWAFSGTEMTLAAALLVALTDATIDFLRSAQGVRRVLFWLALYLLVRPEAPFVVCAALLASAIVESAARRRIAIIGGATVLFSSVIAGARLAYFGRPLPQAPYGRVLELFDLREGVSYFARGDQLASGASLLLILALLGVRRQPILAVFAGAALALVVLAGGDWMIGSRLLLPALPLCLVLALSRGAPRWTVVSALGLEIVCTFAFARGFSTSIPVGTEIVFSRPESAGPLAGGNWLERHNRLHARDLLFVPMLERALRDHGGRPVVRSGQAGMVMFSVARDLPDRFHFIDAGCLTTRTHTAERDADFYFGLLAEPHGFTFQSAADSECTLRDDWLGIGHCEVDRQILAVRSRDP
jgi:hypothetical protein